MAPLEFTKRVCGGVIQTGVNENVFTVDEVADWWGALENDDRAGKYFMAFQGYIVVGTR